MKRLAVVVSCVDAPELAKECTKWLRQHSSPETEIILCDNGSCPPLPKFYADRIVRFHQNIGGNAVFHAMIPHLEALGVEFVAYLHCDLMVRQDNWDQFVMGAFDADPLLALCGFVGSTEMDELGGRGGGTMLNYAGSFYPGFGQATAAEAHGIRHTGIRAGAVLDHCSMIFRLSALKTLPPQEGNYAPGHFYDRICSAEVVNRGFHLALVGVLCDHFSGGVAAGMASQLEVYKRWLRKEGVPYDPNHVDKAVYIESERRFLNRFRDQQFQMIPYRVNPDYSITHFHHTKLRGWVAEPYAPRGGSNEIQS